MSVKVGTRVMWLLHHTHPVGMVFESPGSGIIRVQFSERFSPYQTHDNCMSVFASDCTVLASLTPEEEQRQQDQERRRQHADRYL